MNIEGNNPNFTYTKAGFELTLTTEEKDLEVIVDSSLKGSTQCAEVTKKPNKILGIIGNLKQNAIIQIHGALDLKYFIQFWSPYL